MRQSFVNSANNKFSRLWRQAVLGASLLLTLLFAFSVALQLSSDPVTLVISFVVIAALNRMIATIIHELGHACSAWLVGWQVHLIAVGRFSFAPVRKRFVRLSGYPKQDVGGWVHATPRGGMSWNSGNIPFILGGAVANLALAIVAFGAAAVAYSSAKDVFAVLLGLGETSLIFAVSNLIPMYGDGKWKNDGALLLDALRGVRSTAIEQQTARLYGMWYDGVPFEEWDFTSLDQLASSPAALQDDIFPLLFGCAFSFGDVVTARELLERYLEKTLDPAPDYLFCRAFIIAFADNDPHRAQEILDGISTEHAKRSMGYWRARAVISHLMTNHEDAMKSVKTARIVARQSGLLQLDKDDESLFQAIEKNAPLPAIEPRRRLGWFAASKEPAPQS